MSTAVGSKWDTSRSEWTLEERIEGLRSLSRRFWDSPIDDPEVRRLALGWWTGYPALFVGHSPPKFEKSWDVLHDLTNGVHAAAVKFLMRLAIKHGLDAGALAEAGRLCRELFANQELWNIDAKSRSCPSWPDCLGRRRYELSKEECEIIRDGEKVFQELWLRSGPADAGTTPAAPVDQVLAPVVLTAEVREWIKDLPPDAGLRRAYRRERVWLTWHETEGLGPAAIRDRWNGLDCEARKTIAPSCFETFSGDKGSGANRVKQALIRARRDAEKNKPKRTAKTSLPTTSKTKKRKT
jgi:hypothetical protein